MTVPYDKTGVAPTNLIINEIHTPIIEPDIWPNQGSFYVEGLIVTGIHASNGVSATLVPFIDYIFSPMHSAIAMDTGLEVFSYILLTDRTLWTSITLQYQATGGNPDVLLLSEILAAGPFDRTDVHNWTGFQGDIASLNVSDVDYDLNNTGVVYILASKLDAIAIAMRTPSATINLINGDLATLKSEMASVLSQISSWNTSLTAAGVFSGALSNVGIIGPTGPTGTPGLTGGTGGTGGTGATGGNGYSTSAIPDALSHHTLTKLADGRFLITGGFDGTTQRVCYIGTLTAGVFSWVSTNGLPIPLHDHTCTLLADGRVMVIGGFNSETIVSTSNVYFGTITGNNISWVAGTPLLSALSKHATTLLPAADGRILVIGGADSTGASLNTVYYGAISANTISWTSSTTSLPELIKDHTATLLQDGTILVVDGNNGVVTAVQAVYIGTPAASPATTLTWATVVGNNVPTAVAGHQTEILSDGRFVVSGGVNTGGIQTNNVYIGVNASGTITWVSSNQLPGPLTHHAAAVGTGDLLVITGGEDSYAEQSTVYQGTVASNTITWIEDTGIINSNPSMKKGGIGTYILWNSTTPITLPGTWQLMVDGLASGLQLSLRIM